MRVPKYIACVASYYDTDPSVDVLKSIIITRTKDDKEIVKRSFDLNDYTDDEASDEIEAIIAYYNDRNEDIVTIFGDEPLKVVKIGNQFQIRKISRTHYINIMKARN